jgi:hypothetical protein
MGRFLRGKGQICWLFFGQQVFNPKKVRKIIFKSSSVFMPIGKICTWLAASFFTLDTSVFEADLA